jgi:DNA-binding transcriptional LysR family regulator
MNTHDIEAFVAVVETGSISGAASRLRLTQPGITRRIQNLELTVGTGLLDRLSKPLKPTAAGREAYELGRRVLRSVDDLMSGMAADGTPSGEFRVGITPTMGEWALADPIDRIRAEFPRLSMRVVAGWSPALIQQLTTGSLDAAAVLMLHEIAPPEPLQAVPLGKLELAVAASKRFRLPRRTDLKTVSAFPWIVNPDGCGTRRSIAALFEAAGLPFEMAVEALGIELKLSLAARGIGLVMAPPWAIARSAFRKELSVLEVEGMPQSIDCWLVHPPTPGKLEAPLDRLREALTSSLEAIESPRSRRRKTGPRGGQAAG